MDGRGLFKGFAGDVVWNLVSLGFLALTGVLLNVVIGRTYGAATLGVFSQVVAVYLVLSQFSVGGISYSVLRYVAAHADEPATTSSIIFSALLLVSTLAGAVCLAAFLGRTWIARFFSSPDVAHGLLVILPGLWCFALNKVLLSALNGARRMRTYALGQSLRFALLLAALGIAAVWGISGAMLPGIFSVAEATLLLVLLAYWLSVLGVTRPVAVRTWLRRQLGHNNRGFFVGILSDLNTKVDVIVLGFWASDTVVGLYTFAAMLAEGLAQIPIVVRANLVPILTKLVVRGEHDEISRLARRSNIISVPVMAAVAGVAIVLFPMLAAWFTGRSEFASALPAFTVLLAGIAVTAGYVPFSSLLNQAGYPGWHTMQVALVALSNVLLNAMLVPWMGMLGAAIGTALSMVAGVVFLTSLTRRVAGINLQARVAVDR